MRYLIAVMLLLSMSTAHAFDMTKMYMIQNNYGGLVQDYITAAQVAEEMDTTIVFAGDCMSACTIYLYTNFKLTKCMMPGARFGFHQPRPVKQDDPINNEANELVKFQMWISYPEEIRQFLVKNGWPTDDRVTIMTAKDMEGIIPYC